MSSLLQKTAERYHLPLSRGNEEKLTAFLGLLNHWGRQFNLTADLEPDLLITRHLPDAFVLAQLLTELGLEGSSHLDVGSGGGLPGIPLKICLPSLETTFVEPAVKKASFLRTASHQLGLGIPVLQQRLEDIPEQVHQVLTSRATFAPHIWLERAGPYTMDGGLVIAFLAGKGPEPEAPERMRLLLWREYQLPEGTPRVLGVYRCES